jgi:hypothetical protein
MILTDDPHAACPQRLGDQMIVSPTIHVGFEASVPQASEDLGVVPVFAFLSSCPARRTSWLGAQASRLLFVQRP